MSGVVEHTTVPSVPVAFTHLVETTFAAHRAADGPTGPFRLGCSGGGSGAACHSELAKSTAIDWAQIEFYFADERCVDPTSPDSNERLLREVYGNLVQVAGGFFPMSCAEGASSYAQLLRRKGPFHLLQLGLGPDGHTASLFPGSAGLTAPADLLVIENEDPSGNNPHRRMSLTFSAIASSKLAVVTVIGADKREALARLASGADLPAAHIDAEHVIWLLDEKAAGSDTGPA